MKILAVGGGSGGHVTPVAVILKELHKNGIEYSDIRVWCDSGYAVQTKQKIAEVSPDIKVLIVMSGKFRRFNGVPLLKQLFRLRTVVIPNIRDSILIAFGIAQAFCKLIVWRPDVVFCKGGFTSLPAGLAAVALQIPLVLHDSDAHPGLANRLLAKHARVIMTGAPTELYPYETSKMIYTGIPIDERFVPQSEEARAELKAALGFDSRPLVLITGGGLGAETLNDATVDIASELVKSCNVLLVTGTKQYDQVSKALTSLAGEKSLQVHNYLSSTMIDVLRAADIVVTRGGATALLELSALAKPSIVIPNPYLTGGHQLKNVAAYESKRAVVVLEDKAVVEQPDLMLEAITKLLNDKSKQAELARAIKSFAHYDATEIVATTILKVAE